MFLALLFFLLFFVFGRVGKLFFLTESLLFLAYSKANTLTNVNVF